VVAVVVRYEFECTAVMFVDAPSSLGGHLDGCKNNRSIRIGFHGLWSGDSRPGRVLEVQSGNSSGGFSGEGVIVSTMFSVSTQQWLTAT
jgi:hypothetical protein